MGMDKDIVTNGYIYYVYITDSEFCFAAFQLRYVDSLANNNFPAFVHQVKWKTLFVPLSARTIHAPHRISERSTRASHTRHRSSRLLVVSFMTTPTWRATLPISFILAFPPPRRKCFDSTVRQVHNKSSWRDGAFRLPWYITYYKYGTE